MRQESVTLPCESFRAGSEIASDWVDKQVILQHGDWRELQKISIHRKLGGRVDQKPFPT